MRAVAVLIAIAARIAAQAPVDAALGAARDPSAARLGGGATVRDASGNAFGFPAPLLDADERRAFAVGNSFFKQNWVTAPASTAGRDGLGPLFNARSCSGCHLRDGRSRPPHDDEPDRQGLLLRLGVVVAGGVDLPHPLYGAQLQDDAVHGVAPEARVAIHWHATAGAFADGECFELIAPRYELLEPAYGPLGDGVVLGGRTAPHLIGLGLLEAIPVAAILARADAADRDGDGVSGRPHWLPGGRGGEPQLGRFGWKAAQPTVLAQTAAAFANDIGITSSLVPDEPLTAVQRERLGRAGGGAPEIDDHKLDRVVFYTRTLAVPEQRTPDAPSVVAGRRLFGAFGCAACHVPKFTTGDDAFHPAFAGQTIRPFTDLLLHDMGEGLADGKRDGDAGPSEWRTPPLWGIGLFAAVSGHTRYLHDGRARDLAEAILWHGGEAEAAKERFRRAPRTEREALLAFLDSL